MRKLLVIMLVVSLSAVMLTGCTNSAENVEDTGSEQIVTEEESQVVTEESEVASEEISEESSEEVAEVTVDYSAESVMAKIDEIITACPYDDSEQIKAAVIGVNLEYISDEDLTTLMDTYGYTLEELKDLFDAYMEQYFHHMWLTHRYNIGAGEVIDTMDLEKDLLKYRANIADMFIGQEEVKITVEYIVLALSNNDTESFASYIFPDEYEAPQGCPYNCEGSELTDGQKAIVNYIILYNEICGYNDVETVANRLANVNLPYDVKLNAQ